MNKLYIPTKLSSSTTQMDLVWRLDSQKLFYNFSMGILATTLPNIFDLSLKYWELMYIKDSEGLTSQE